MSPSLPPYLIAAKAGIQGKAIDLLVMGNEAADLDSLVSAIAFAYIYNGQKKGETILPFMPIARADFNLRSEAVYLFKQAGIDPDTLIFMDDISPRSLMDRVKALAIVDHNKLSPGFDAYKDKLAIIIDHHKDQGRYPRIDTRIIEPVGSTATLVGDILIREHPELIDKDLALLLTGTILLDTINLDPGAGRVTSKDTKVAKALMKACPLDQDQCFAAVQKAKFDTANLGTSDLLRKDYKEFKFGDLRCGMASVLLSADQWGQKDKDICRGFETYAEDRDLDILISMNAYYTASEFHRDLIVYAIDPKTHDRLIAFLEQEGLDLNPMDIPPQTPLDGKISFHTQGNSSISRKKLSPMLDEYFTSQPNAPGGLFPGED